MASKLVVELGILFLGVALTYESFLAGPPIILQKAFFITLKPIALLLGYRSYYRSTPSEARQGDDE